LQRSCRIRRWKCHPQDDSPLLDRKVARQHVRLGCEQVSFVGGSTYDGHLVAPRAIRTRTGWLTAAPHAGQALKDPANQHRSIFRHLRSLTEPPVATTCWYSLICRWSLQQARVGVTDFPMNSTNGCPHLRLAGLLRMRVIRSPSRTGPILHV